jgi:hypothetical protein
MALSDFQSLVQDLVRDDANHISDPQRNAAIDSAVARYSKDRPRQKVEDVAATGANTLPLPTNWQAGYSDLLDLEHPIGQVPPSRLPAQTYSLYATPSGETIMLTNAVQVGAQVRVTYSIAHALSNAEDTITLGDREPVCCLAAASLCDQLASLYSGDSDSTIQADSVNHQSKAGEFASRAKVLRKRYLDELGIDAKKNVATGVVVEFPKNNSRGGDRLTRGRGYY